MKMYTAHLDVRSALEAPRQCEGCGARQMAPETDGKSTRFACQSCGLRWEASFGWIRPVSAPGGEEHRCASA
jgi:hypothetical protein